MFMIYDLFVSIIMLYTCRPPIVLVCSLVCLFVCSVSD